MNFDRHSLAELFVARFQRIVTAPVPLIASTARRPALWRWLNRRRIETITLPPLDFDRRTLADRRRSDSIAEKMSAWRVRQAWQRKGLTDADGRLHASKFIGGRKSARIVKLSR